ncbi:uncharacterized protein LOC111049691 isoform X2 [Nilaparvata lugens]|uniref:uncharacterized protein LOC111049691 isoform X2 n=1 Tax=Nilaparvata lugens TaxID=108931 RepID=UPI00193DBA4C|nr:uncharacterized protein LOC111049691 isoform X2 [Nilaparvata lugens]
MAVELKNMMPSDVRIMWARPDGHQMQYGVVSAKQADSGSAHTGRLAEETLNGLRLLIDGRRHYVAVTPGHSVASLEIRAPLHSLAELVRGALRQAVYLSATSAQLDLPATLLRDLDQGIALMGTPTSMRSEDSRSDGRSPSKGSGSAGDIRRRDVFASSDWWPVWKINVPGNWIVVTALSSLSRSSRSPLQQLQWRC